MSKEVKCVYTLTPYMVFNLMFWCFGVYRFTSAVRTGFTFTGQEHFQFAGGEDLWVFVNKVLVLRVIRHNESSVTPCKTFQLKNATGNFI